MASKMRNKLALFRAAAVARTGTKNSLSMLKKLGTEQKILYISTASNFFQRYINFSLLNTNNKQN
jgi:hypothetical protein